MNNNAVKKNAVINVVKEYIILAFASFLMGFGIYFFRFPNNFSFGGVAGIAVLLANVIPISASNISLVLNIALLIVGVIVLGKSFGLKSGFSTVILSFSVSFLEIIYPMDAPLTDEPLLECCFAVILAGVSSAIIFNLDASSGGTDIIAMIIKKYTSFNVGSALMIADFFVAAFAFSFGIKTGLLSLLGWFTKGLIIDSVIESFNKCKVFTIICKDPENITNFITQELNRSATIEEAVGAYTHDKRFVITSIVNRSQAVKLRNYTRQHAPESFISISNSSEIIGNGFRSHI